MPGFPIFILVTVLMSGCGFYDYERAETEKIVGNIYAVNLYLPDFLGYYVVFLTNSGNEHPLTPLNENVEYIKSSDAVILIKTIKSLGKKFYLVQHDQGKNIPNVQNLTEFEFSSYERNMKSKYQFINPALSSVLKQ